MFNKMFFMKIMMVLISAILIMTLEKKINLEINLINSEFNMLSFSLSMDKISLTFMLMVATVTSAVISFSTVYMESYNKKKFFWIMILFFYSMMILSFSNSVTSTITGWDGLGITSIMLIMMYQNNTTMSNSMITMFFNRVGDFTMFVAISMMLMNMNEKFFSTPSNFNNILMSIFLMITAMTKSAQVPLSAWLPAAMSAPTPISAMVHSSTLVTAGIFIVMKMYESLSNIFYILLPTSCLTLMLASISANMEKDLKKIVAFSTMSQISIIMIMCASKMKPLAMAHMFNHAMFKTMTFMSSGLTFMENNSNQDKRKIKSLSSMKMNKIPLSASMISMAGTPFSASFFSKDKFMESLKWENKSLSSMIIMAMAGIATILYCKQIISTLNNQISKNSSLKKTKKESFAMLTTLSIISGSSMNWIMETHTKPILNKKEVLMINFTTILACFVKNLKAMKKLSFISNNMFFMKWLTTNIFFKVKNSKSMELMENLTSKNSAWKLSKSSISVNYPISKSMIMILMIITIFMM